MQIRIADYEADYAAIRAIRFRVFVDEQGVPAAIEMDDRDPDCIHLLAFEGDQAIATARIDLALNGKIGRLAVDASSRGRGCGRALMERCHEIAQNHGLDAVWCNAQAIAVPFYERLGYRCTGEPFDEAGIEHRRMIKRLAPGRD